MTKSPTPLSDDAVALREGEITALRWMVSANSRNMGLYGPSLSEPGQSPDADSCVARGLAEWRYPVSARKTRRRGYFITAAGRSALQAIEGEG